MMSSRVLIVAALWFGGVGAYSQGTPTDGSAKSTGSSDPDPVRNAKPIPFRRGHGRATVAGKVGKGDNPAYWFQAQAGQKLTYAFHQPKSSGLALTWTILFPSGKSFGTKGLDPFDGKLTESGKYTIVVGRNNMASNSMSGPFQMTLTLTRTKRKS